MRSVLVVDAANVVGARADGWWKDRPGAARRLHEELLVADVPGDEVVLVLEGAAKAQVSYTTPSGEALTRDVELPPDRERSVQVVSWLTVNLVRDEASELLDALRARSLAGEPSHCAGGARRRPHDQRASSRGGMSAHGARRRARGDVR